MRTASMQARSGVHPTLSPVPTITRPTQLDPNSVRSSVTTPHSAAHVCCMAKSIGANHCILHECDATVSRCMGRLMPIQLPAQDGRLFDTGSGPGWTLAVWLKPCAAVTSTSGWTHEGQMETQGATMFRRVVWYKLGQTVMPHQQRARAPNEGMQSIWGGSHTDWVCQQMHAVPHSPQKAHGGHVEGHTYQHTFRHKQLLHKLQSPPHVHVWFACQSIIEAGPVAPGTEQPPNTSHLSTKVSKCNCH